MGNAQGSFSGAGQHSRHCAAVGASVDMLKAIDCDAVLVLHAVVFFLDETFEELEYDVTTTVLEAVEQLAGIIKLQVGCGWGRRRVKWPG